MTRKNQVRKHQTSGACKRMAQRRNKCVDDVTKIALFRFKCDRCGSEFRQSCYGLVHRTSGACERKQRGECRIRDLRWNLQTPLDPQQLELAPPRLIKSNAIDGIERFCQDILYNGARLILKLPPRKLTSIM